MKYKMRKFMCLAMVFMTMLLNGIPVSAASGAEPSESDANAVFIYNIEEDVTVIAYQIIDAVYDEKGNGLTGYTTVSNLSIADIGNPSAAEINAIATQIYDGTLSGLESKTLTYAAAGDTVEMSDTTTEVSVTLEEEAYYGALEAGMWIVLVWNSNTTVYNPMIVSNWYEDANDASSLTSGSVDAEGNFCENIYAYTIGEDGSVEYTQNDEETVTIIYAKKSSVPLDKDIVNYAGSEDGEDAHEGIDADFDAADGSDWTEGADYNIGDTVTFEITTVIPDYADVYFDVTSETGTATFTIVDTMSVGLDALSYEDFAGTQYTDGTISAYDDSSQEWNGNVTVTVGGTVYAAKEQYVDDDGLTQESTNYVVTLGETDEGEQTITIAFTSAFIKAHGAQSVVITYETTLNADAQIVGDTSANANPNSVDLIYSNHPTSVFNTEDNGTGDTVYVYTFSLTDEIAKVYNDDADGTAAADGNTVNVTNPLAGAKFTIYTDASCKAGTEAQNVYVYEVTYDETTGTWTRDTSGGLVRSSVCTTADDGFVCFYGLSEGTYYVTETEAPDGYTINDTIYEIVICANYGEYEDVSEAPTEGMLLNWSLTVTNLTTGETRTNQYTVSYEDVTETKSFTGSGSTVTVYSVLSDEPVVTASQEPTAVLDSVLIQLPSTGGMGLYLLIGASVLIFTAAVVISVRKKKDRSDEAACDL